MGCCCSAENQYSEQGTRLATARTHLAIANNAKTPYRNSPVQPPASRQRPPASRQRPPARPPASRQRPKKIPDRKPPPDSIITSLDELVWPSLDEPPTRRPDNRRGHTRSLSILSADPQKEFRNMPELVSPVLPPEGVYYEGYVPPVPEKIPEVHSRFNGVTPGPPTTPPKELEGMQRGGEQTTQFAPALPPRPDRMRGETAPAPLTNDHHPIFAELPSQRRVAELAGLPPPAELDDTLVPNPLHEQVRFRYRDAVPYAPNFSELPAHVLPVSPSGTWYSPHLVGSETNLGLHEWAIQPRVASPRHADTICEEMDAVGATYELDDRQRSPHRQVVKSLIPSDGYTTGAGTRYVRQRAGGSRKS